MLHRELPAVEPFVIGWKYPLMELRTDPNPEAMKKPKGGQAKKHDPRELLSAIRLSTPKKPVSISAWAEAGKVSRQTLQGYLPTLRAKGGTATVGEGQTARQHITQAGKEARENWSDAGPACRKSVLGSSRQPACVRPACLPQAPLGFRQQQQADGLPAGKWIWQPYDSHL